jgi:hypothetical protein
MPETSGADKDLLVRTASARLSPDRDTVGKLESVTTEECRKGRLMQLA